MAQYRKPVAGIAINGTSGADRLFGGAGADTLRGGSGTDRLDGAAGADSMVGGRGDDRYQVDHLADIVTESSHALGGIDTVVATVDWVLGRYQENLVLTGAGDLVGTGNRLANVLTGNSGDNVLAGGSGNDTLAGGAGDDHLLGGSGDDAIKGGDGSDTLTGGSGADTMVGGSGADTYYVDSADDRIVEKMSYRIDLDTVISSVNRKLGANQDILVLTGGALKGSGNGHENWLKGNDHDNVLNGGGGSDTLSGGKGNDTYRVDRWDELIVESTNGGIDHVISTVDHTLAYNVEHLTLTGKEWTSGTGNESDNRITGGAGRSDLSGMSGADTLSGGEGKDRLWGGSDADRINGGAGNDTIIGGEGADTLSGGAGADVFGYEEERDSTPRRMDTITDFERGKDVIDLTAIYFGANGAFKPFIGTAAFDPTDATGQVRYEYDPATGSVVVYVSADATGDAEGALRLLGVSSLSARDFNFFD